MWNKEKKEAYLINHLTLKVTLAHLDDDTFRITAFDVTPLSLADSEIRTLSKFSAALLYLPQKVPETDDDEVMFTVSYQTTIENNSHRMDHYAGIKQHYEWTYHKELGMTFSCILAATVIMFSTVCC